MGYCHIIQSTYFPLVIKIFGIESVPLSAPFKAESKEGKPGEKMNEPPHFTPQPTPQPKPFLPLLQSREALLVLELLSMGCPNRFPNLIGYYSHRRGPIALWQMRKECLFQFSQDTFLDCITTKVNGTSNQWNIQTIIREILRRIQLHFYPSWALSRGLPWLDAAILIVSGETEFTLFSWTEWEYLHWRLYFAKSLLYPPERPTI